jgi:hypothetical protein
MWSYTFIPCNSPFSSGSMNPGMAPSSWLRYIKLMSCVGFCPCLELSIILFVKTTILSLHPFYIIIRVFSLPCSMLCIERGHIVSGFLLHKLMSIQHAITWSVAVRFINRSWV